MARHPGISMHKLPVGGNVMGAVFVIGVVVMFLVGIPLARWFLLGGIVLGGLLAMVFAAFHKRRSVEITDLSGVEGQDRAGK